MNNIPNELLIHISSYADDKTRHRMMRVSSSWYDTLTSEEAILSITKKKCRYRSVEYREYLYSTTSYTYYIREKWERFIGTMMLIIYIIVALFLSGLIPQIIGDIDVEYTRSNYDLFLQNCQKNRSMISWWNNRYYNLSRCNDSISILSYDSSKCFKWKDDPYIYVAWQCLPEGILFSKGEIVEDLIPHMNCKWLNPKIGDLPKYIAIGSIYQICSTTSISWYMSFIGTTGKYKYETSCITYKGDIQLHRNCP